MMSKLHKNVETEDTISFIEQFNVSDERLRVH